MKNVHQHLRQAVALRYDSENEQAPCVVAKGRGVIAEKIIAAAKTHGIPLVADPDMSRALGEMDLGAEIPPEFYLAVAEILAFVYRLKRTGTKS
jgi:flagellar biosynthesis protein